MSIIAIERKAGAMTKKAEWLASLKVGDPVLIRTWPYANRRYIREVSRITKTLIVTKDGWRFRRKDGYVPGDLWCQHWIEKPTRAQTRKAGR